MTAKLQLELRQKIPFANPQHEAFLNILRTADQLERSAAELLKQHGITTAQYNVLRILQGAGENGRSCSDISRRMLVRYPDVTRILDRMERDKLVQRNRDGKDRRAVLVKLTSRAEAVLAQLAEPLNELHLRQFAALSTTQVSSVIDQMEAIRINLEARL